MINRMKRYGPIALILLMYLVVGSLYAVYNPDWQAPDEPAHYNVVRQLAEGTFPVIEPADYDQDFQGQAISSGFDPVYDVPDRYFSYEDWQPPLYYLLLVPIYWLFDGALEPLRLASLVLGAGVVLLTYGVAWLIWRREAWALTAAAFVAFLPQHLAIMASLNNDALAELLIAAILYLLVRGAVSCEPLALSPPPSPLSPLSVSQSPNLPSPLPLLLLGTLLGLGFLTKGSVYIMAPLIGVVFLWRYWGAWRQVARVGLIVGGAAALLALPWWLRNSIVYEGLDPIAWQAHGEVVVGQPRTVEWFEQFGVDGTLQRFFSTTFRSFWGQFGWMGVVMPTWVYQLLGLFTAVVGVGLIAAAVQSFHSSRQSPKRHFILPPSSLILLLNLAFTLLLYLGYNITFVQHQGRYLFSALIPLACGVALGLGTLWDKVSGLRTTHHAPRTTSQISSFKFQVSEFMLPVGLAIALVGLDLLALFRFILPQLGRG